MNWVRNNRFLAGFLAVMLLGVGGFGFLLYSALDHYNSVDERYKTQVTELKRLEALQPFPNQANQAKYEVIRKDYAQSVRDLQMTLANFEPPAENPPPTPLQFQDRLRALVEEAVGTAQRAGVGLPKEKFYLGFEQYSGTPPEAAATPLLSSELNAINDLMGILLSKRIDSLAYIKRGLLPGEVGAAAAAAPIPGPGRAVANAPAAASPLVVKYPVEFAFTAQPSSFREILNTITTSKQLFLVRAVQIKNQVDKGPARAVTDPNAPGGPGAAGAAGAAAPDASSPNGAPLPDKAQPALRYVVGQEKLDVILRIELARVTPPPAAPVR